MSFLWTINYGTKRHDDDNEVQGSRGGGEIGLKKRGRRSGGGENELLEHNIMFGFNDDDNDSDNNQQSTWLNVNKWWTEHNKKCAALCSEFNIIFHINACIVLIFINNFTIKMVFLWNEYWNGPAYKQIKRHKRKEKLCRHEEAKTKVFKGNKEQCML